MGRSSSWKSRPRDIEERKLGSVKRSPSWRTNLRDLQLPRSSYLPSPARLTPQSLQHPLPRLSLVSSNLSSSAALAQKSARRPLLYFNVQKETSSVAPVKIVVSNFAPPAG